MKKPVIRLNNERFKQFVKTSPRNYSMFVMFTALAPQRQCAACKYDHLNIVIVVSSSCFVSSTSTSIPLLFIVLDKPTMNIN
jgi:oligosaccharyltransferase complex subunit gamma